MTHMHKTEGFRDIPESCQREISGGSLLGSLLVAAGAAVIGAASYNIFRDWDNFKNGLLGLPEENATPDNV
jgi:hypothetical protein